MTLTHSFSVEHAQLYGVECAILIHHLQYWIQYNQGMDRNFHVGRTWMYQTQKEISALYLYWSEDTVSRLMNKLVDYGVIIKGNFNKVKYDRTVWYAFKNEEKFIIPRFRGIDSTPSRNGSLKSAEPIPDSIPAAKQTTTQEAKPPAAVSVKKEKIYSCLVRLSVPEKDKIRISAKYDEPTVSQAVKWTQLSSTKIKTSLVKALWWACDAKPSFIEESPQIEGENKAYASKVISLLNLSKGEKIELLEKAVSFFIPNSRGAYADSLRYLEFGFKEQFNNILRKLGLWTTAIECKPSM